MSETISETLSDTLSDTISVDFKSLMLPVSDLVLNLPYEQQKDIFTYLQQLDEHNRKAYLIAKEHLGTSFTIYKSNGYKEWRQKIETIDKQN